MHRISLAMVVLGLWLAPIAAASAQTPASPPPPDEPAQLARRVLDIFEHRCAACHDAGRAKPKGALGHILELERLAADEDLVVAGEPDDSLLVWVIEDGTMPPEEAEAGPVSPDELAAIRAWIAAGAPHEVGAAPAPADRSGEAGRDGGKGETASSTPPPGPIAGKDEEAPVSGEPAPPANGSDASSTDETNATVRRTIRYLGRLHPLVVHFPIALIIVAAALELVAVPVRWTPLKHASGVCLSLGVFFAVAAAVTGWMNAQFAGYGAGVLAEVLERHRWSGIAVGAGTLVTVLLLAVSRKPERTGLRMAYRLALIALALLTAYTAHLGGTLIYGLDYLEW